MNYLDVFLALCAALLIFRCMYRSDRLPLPPGPKSLPGIGNMLDMPKQKPWETYSKWGKKYGDVVYISLLGKSLIIVNTFSVASELFERRSSIYSGRPQTTISSLIGFDKATAVQPYGASWRKHRTVYQKHFNQKASQEYHNVQMAEVRKLLRSVLDTPHEYIQHLVRKMSAGIVMNVVYAHEISSKADPFVALAEGITRGFSHSMRPGAYLVDLIPALKHVPEWVPGAGFQTFVRKSRDALWKARNIPFKDVKQRMVSGTARPSFVANALGEQTVEEEIIRNVAAGVYGAGSDTTSSSIHSFILAMVLYPEVQKKAQAELDHVIGGERLPYFRDRAQLPYVEAVFKEVFRWNPVAPTGIAHSTTEEDNYKGYRIPKGAIVIGNSWAILHDPDMYPDPFTFRPERFLSDGSRMVARNPATAGTFGFGRRICPGRHLGDASVWIAIASLLAAFDIAPAIDENGCEIDAHYALEGTPGLLIHPRPFPCSIKPRSGEAEKLIKLM